MAQMTYSAKINALAIRLALVLPGEGADALSGILKVLAKCGPGAKVARKDLALILTAAEEAALLRGGVRMLVRLGSRFFLFASVVNIVVSFLSGEQEHKTIEERFQLIEAHLLKGGARWSTVLGVGEQLLFIVNDTTDNAVVDTLLSPLSPLAGAQAMRILQAEGDVEIVEGGQAAPAGGLPVDVELQAPGFILKPELATAPKGAITFPSGPKPSIGRRS